MFGIFLINRYFRFGKIASIVTLFELEAGTELFTSYNYSINDCPEWYLQQPTITKYEDINRI